MSWVVAPSAFKGTLTCHQAAGALCRAFSSDEARSLASCPLADGGHGTLDVLTDALGGVRFPLVVSDPAGSRVDVEIGLLPTGIAVVEMALCSRDSGAGMPVDILHRTSKGLGEMISAALDHSPRRIIVGLGGSATCDGGLGALQALGVGFFDDAGHPISTPADLVRLNRVDDTFRDSRLDQTELILACDVANPLVGAEGAARVFGPQKGATPAQVEALEAGLQRLAEVLLVTRGRWVAESAGGGAAGGAAAGLNAIAGGEIRAGFQLISELLGFERLLEEASLLVIGEGSIDQQSKYGKATLAASTLARDRGVPVWAVAGRIELTDDVLRSYGVVASADLSTESDRLEDPARALERVATSLLQRHGAGIGQAGKP